MNWAEHPVKHLKKVAIAYKKHLALGAVSKMNKRELIAVLDKHLSLGENGEILIKPLQGKVLNYKMEKPKAKSIRVKEIKKEEIKKEEIKKEEIKEEPKKKEITDEDVINEWDTPQLGVLFSQYLLSNDTKRIESLFKMIENNNKKGKPNFDDLGLSFTKEFNDIINEKYGKDILFKGLRNILQFFGAENIVKRGSRGSIEEKPKIEEQPKKEIKPIKQKLKIKEKKDLKPKIEEKPKMEEKPKPKGKEKEITREDVINEWDTPQLGIIFSQYLLSTDAKRGESIIDWIENKNKAEKPIFDDLGLIFTKEFNDEVFEKYGRDVLFEGVRNILEYFGADNVVDMDKPPRQRIIKQMNSKNKKKLQQIENSK